MGDDLAWDTGESLSGSLTHFAPAKAANRACIYNYNFLYMIVQTRTSSCNAARVLKVKRTCTCTVTECKCWSARDKRNRRN